MTPADAKRTGKLRLPPWIGRDLSGARYGLTVEGNEYAPRICKGDTVIVDPAASAAPRDMIVYWPAEAEGRPLLRKLEEAGTGAEKPETGATVHSRGGVSTGVGAL